MIQAPQVVKETIMGVVSVPTMGPARGYTIDVTIGGELKMRLTGE